MSLTGVNYFSTIAEADDQLLLFYGFTGWTGAPPNRIRSIGVSNPLYSGNINGTGSFYRVSGSGFFGGDTTISVNNASGLNNNNWTMVFDYEVSGNQNSVLFSNYTSGAINSGWVIGLSNLNSPYIEYYSNVGPKVLLSQNNYGTKNTIFLTKNNNNLTLDYFDYNAKNFETEQFNIEDRYMLPSNNWLIGGYTGAPRYFSGEKYKGYINTFLYYSPPLLPHQRLKVVSGLYCDVYNPVQYTATGTYFLATGTTTGLVPIFSGTTGEANVLVEYLLDGLGSPYVKYAVTGITGIVYDIGNITLYQTLNNITTGYSGGGVIENSGLSISHGMNAISFLKNNNTGDFTELYYFQNVTNKNNINQELIYDRTINQYISPVQHSLTELNLYINSVSQFGSGYTIIGDYYGQSQLLSGMYFISGNYFSGSYENNDTSILDIITGIRSFSTGGLTVISTKTGISNFPVGNSMVFFNGQKLKSGIDYSIVGTRLNLNSEYLTSIEGNYWTFPIDSQSTYNSGIWNNTGNMLFARDTSMVYMNGMRQNLSNDYEEISNFSLLNNTSNYVNGLSVLYSNENNFTESI